MNRKLYIVCVLVLRVLASLGTHYEGEWKEMHTSWQKLLIKSLRVIGLERVFPQRRVYGMLDKLYRRYRWNQSKFSGTISASLFSKELIPTEIWGKGCLKEIRETFFLVPEKYDDYLKRLYGNNYLSEEPQNKKSHLAG